jgi:hypothetical protein
MVLRRAAGAPATQPAARRNPEMGGQRDLGLPEGNQKLLAEDLARVGGDSVCRLHSYPLW